MFQPRLATASIALVLAGSALAGAGVALRTPWAGAAVAVAVLGVVVGLRRERDLVSALASHDEHARMATTDHMTGLLNRRGLDIAARSLVSTAQRLGQPVTVWFMDIDGLKATNDRVGHDAGDELIRAVATALAQSARLGDLVARVGGDEFTVIGLGAGGDPEDLAKRIRHNLDPALLTRIPAVKAGPLVSVGCAVGMINDTVTLAELTRRADHDMYGRRQQRRATRGEAIARHRERIAPGGPDELAR